MFDKRDIIYFIIILILLTINIMKVDKHNNENDYNNIKKPDIEYNYIFKDSIVINLIEKDSTIYRIKEEFNDEIKEVNNYSDSSAVELFKQLTSE